MMIGGELLFDSLSDFHSIAVAVYLYKTVWMDSLAGSLK